MPDPRFARLKTDPRFRKPRKQTNKVVVDDRFKSIFDDGANRNKGKVKSVKIDKYGKKISATHDSDNLRRFYRLEEERQAADEVQATPDYARGEGLVESSDEEQVQESESDDGEVVLGRNIEKPLVVPENEFEIDLDESQFAELDAQAAVNLAKADDTSVAQHEGENTNRLALVNLDWDHVRASHLFKIFSSVLSPSPSGQRDRDRGANHVSKDKVLHVRVYPSDFGKKRIAQEEREGPPKELFKQQDREDDINLDDETLILEDDGKEYNEEALRKYQLERLRYYYAIITCDTVEAATHIYSELDGTELERSANTFDLSFVPNTMSFDENFRDEATQESLGTYKAVEFVTDALRHSRVKLTWDDDDAERNSVTRRTLSRKEIEESDFKAYLASSGSEDDGSDVDGLVSTKRDRMRTLLLSGNDADNELLPEGWGQDIDKAGEMEVTFTPGLSGGKDVDGEDETTLQQYLRKQKERRKKRKVDKADKKPKDQSEGAAVVRDEFFGEDSNQEDSDAMPKTQRKGKGKSPPRERVASTAAELELVLAPDIASGGQKHFDMRSVVKAEKASFKKKGKKSKQKGAVDEDEAQEDFTIDVKDDRFKALHEDHNFAIDPSHPYFKKTKSMAALLDERSKRQHNDPVIDYQTAPRLENTSEGSLKSLVESVKRKSTLNPERGGKRRRL